MQRIGFLVLAECSHFSLAAAIEPLFIANWLAQRPLFDWKIVSADGTPVRASNGTVIPVDGDLAAAADCTSVFVLASFDPDQAARSKPVLRWLRRLARFGIELAGVENGTWVLAEAGLLDGHRVAIHWDNLIGFQERYPAVQAVAQLYAESGDRLTCAGASAVLDMMVNWIGRHADPDLAAEAAQHLLLWAVRSQGSQQSTMAGRPSPEPDIKVVAAQAIMRDRLDERVSCREIARQVGLSLRQTERRFARHLGRSMAQEYLLLRMAKAHQLLQQTSLAVSEVAFSCGFSSPEHFSRTYRRQFGCAPSRDRRQSTNAPVLRLKSARGS